MTTHTPPTTTYHPGKAPVLLDTSPAGLTAYSRAAKLYFRTKSVKEEEDKIAYVGAGLVLFPELHNWYLASADAHESKKYDSFFLELQRRALPQDYVWDARRRIREARQGDADYEDWADEMRTTHLALTERVVTTYAFVEALLYGMDDELSATLRQGTSLRNTGLHQDEVKGLAFSAITTAYPASMDYEAFDREARTEWSRIATRRRANAAQLRQLTKKAAALSTSSSSRSSSSPSNGKAKSSSTTTPTTHPSSDNATATRPARLTDLERDWLSATHGCFKCRRSNAGHESASCTTWAPADWVVRVPAGWTKGQTVPASTGSDASPNPTSGKVGVRALHTTSSDEVDVPASFADDSDSDGCAFPPLHLSIRGSSRRSRSALALADSGSTVTLISERLASELELERLKLSRPKQCRVASQGGGDDFIITDFVRAPVRLENGSWSAGITTFLVAPVEEPFDIILGIPFFRQHQASLAVSPDFAILIPQENGLEPFDLLAPLYGPQTAREVIEGEDDAWEKSSLLRNVVTAHVATLKTTTEAITKEDADMAERATRLMRKFDDLFPSTLPPLTQDYLSKTSTRHRIRLNTPDLVHNQRGFNVPRKWREAWKRMLEGHLASGRLRPSTSPYASAAFVVPKKDPTADPRWVNDYRRLNSNTVKDRTPLPLPDLVLADASLAKIWGKIDMTNAFFQTPMAEEDITKTAIKTPWGLFEWTVMPQGLCNAPATHQARVNEALRHLIGVCCQAFVDDIIIYSNSMEEHEINCRAVLSALQNAGLYCSRKKTDLFTLRTEFLGHIISRQGLEADPTKTEKIRNWTRPTTISQVRGFLGIVQYLRKFIPGLAEHTAVLTPLTKKGLTNIEHLWSDRKERAFEAIKQIVTSLPVLRPIDQASHEPIWLMTDASKVGIGAVLLQGKDWRTAKPCGFFSRQYIAAEKNYPTHEQELLAVVAAMKAWRIDLLGVHFHVLTDHDTLKHFHTQPTLSKRQARWTETLADYDFELSYLPGKYNTVADSMSRFSFSSLPTVAVRGISEFSLSEEVVARLKAQYEQDEFCKQIIQGGDSNKEFSVRNGLIYFESNRIVVPSDKQLREALLHDAHDTLGHLGARKTLGTLSLSFFWPRMAKDVDTYVSTCDGCQQHKARTQKRGGKLHSLPVPPRPFSDIALDFVGPLPTSEGKDMLLTVTDRLTGYCRLFACRSRDGAKEIAETVFRGWFSLFGLPERLVSDRDRLFTSRFWRSLHTRLGMHLQMSTSFHPETDGRSERTNKFGLTTRYL